LQFLIKKINKKISAVFFSPILGHQTLDLDPDAVPNLDSLEIMDPDPDSMNPDLLHSILHKEIIYSCTFYLWGVSGWIEKQHSRAGN
jgi:hypothetical protein